MSISFKGKYFRVKQEIVHVRFKDVEMKTLNLRKKKIDSISNLIGLENLHDLEALILDKNRITEIEKIPDLKNLKYLSLKYNKIHDIKIMGMLPQLIELNLTGNEITEISGLEYLPNLQVLHLENNQITEINNLEYLQKLEFLNLDNNQITEIKNLEYLQKLEFLYLDNNQITEIKNLENLKHLFGLNLNNNQITEVKNLDKSRLLRRIYLKNNRITRIFPIHLQYLNEFDISGNPFYIFLKSRFAIISAKKIIEYSINPEDLEKRLGVGKKNIYVPLDYSNLANDIPRNEDILYSTLCHVSKVVPIPSVGIPQFKRIRWKAHILLTESGFGITVRQGRGEVGTKFLEWGSMWKVKSKAEGLVLLVHRSYRIKLRPLRATDFESEGSFRNRSHSFQKLCVSLWEEHRKQKKITEKLLQKTYYCDSCGAEIISEDLKCNECGTNNKKRIKKLKKLEAQEKRRPSTHEGKLERVKTQYYDLNRTIQDIADDLGESMMTVKKFLNEIENQETTKYKK